MKTFSEFEHDLLHIVIPTKDRHLRNGQAIMIYLAQINFSLYDKITATEYDCFYVDKQIEKTLKYLKQNWN